MDIPACPAAQPAQVVVVTSLSGIGFQEKEICRAIHVIHFSLLCLEKLVSPEFLAGLLAANELRNMELENIPQASCLANGDILHVSGACLRSPGTWSLLC